MELSRRGFFKGALAAMAALACPVVLGDSHGITAEAGIGWARHALQELEIAFDTDISAGPLLMSPFEGLEREYMLTQGETRIRRWKFHVEGS